MSTSSHGRRWWRALVAAALAAAALTTIGAPPAAAATTYSQSQTLPVPPASSFIAQGGGDGWDISLSNDRVYNVFHHQAAKVACHLQSNATRCWPSVSKSITDELGRSFYAGNHSGTHLEQSTGKLYLYAYRMGTSTGGVVCIDTKAADSVANPFCGFTALTPNGGTTLVGQPMLVGTRWYAVSRGATNGVMCFDIASASACAGQPYTIDFTGFGGGPHENSAAVGTRLFVHNTSNNALSCFDTATSAECIGTWPAAAGHGHAGAPLPLLDATGTPIGVCVRSSNACRAFDGAVAATPSGIANVIGPGTYYNGPAVTIGPRVYAPNGNIDAVQCYDYSTGARCANFPKALGGSFMYTVNRDPQRPSCLWTNADNGQRIQSFDAYTAGPCGQGAIRVLASQFVVPLQDCVPTAYDRLEILAPARDTYASGEVQFANGAGNAIGIPAQAIDDAGGIDLTGLSLNTATGLPQFLVSLDGATGAIGQVEVKLTWTGAYDPSCVAPATEVTKEPTSVTATVTGGGDDGAAITVDPGTSVSASASVSGVNAASAGGTVTYTWYSDAECSVAAAGGEAQTVTAGQLPDAASVDLPIGTYRLVAAYSGDVGNEPSASACGGAVLRVKNPDDTPPVIVAQATTEPNEHGWYAGDVTVTFTCTDEEGGSGIPDGTCPASQVLTGEGEAVSSTAVEVADAAHNVGASNVVTVQIDRTAPLVAFAGGRGTYSALDDVAISCTAGDSLSGVASDDCSDVTGAAWTFGPGTHTRTASAIDKAGNSASASISFEVTSDSGSLRALVAEFTTHSGTRTSLGAHLTNYERSKAAGKTKPAAAQLQSFRDGVNERIGKQFTAEQASVLLSFSVDL